MKGNIHISVASILAMILVLSTNTRGEDPWSAQFDTTYTRIVSLDSKLSFDDVLKLVAARNPAFRSFSFQSKAAQSNLEQAGLWSNPEFTAEIEEVGWDAPGFRESEFTISLAQEFEFFGQRGARRNVAKAEIDATNLQIKLAAFDLYLETKKQFYSLAHAQQNVMLSEGTVTSVKEIVENITFRLERGAALQSELLLAQLEEQRAQLALDQAKQDVMAIEATLVSLWNGKPSGLTVSSNTEPDFAQLLDQITSISNRIDSTRDIAQMLNESEILQAEKKLAAAEAKPTITLSGGIKRVEVNDSRSFLFGISLPIPFFNRNQGTRESIDARLRSLEYKIEQSINEKRAYIQSQTIRLNQLIDKHATLGSLLLPTAEQVYRTLYNAYESGRVPFTQLLEAERSLIDIGFEYNDILLAIHEQIIALEHVSGVALRTDKEN
jgi:cobalt-zinc-cadmium efflux system outer membrane protein